MRAFEEEFDYLHRAVRRLGVTGSDAEDLVQDVFVVMWRRWSDYQQDRPLRPWMVGIAAHLAYRHKRRRLREVFGARLELVDDDPLPEERMASHATRALVLRVLGELPTRHRIPLVMHEIEGLTMVEITHLLGIPLATAYTRVRRARLAFAAALERLSLASTDAPLDPRLVLAAEQTPPPVPVEARRRALSRAEALLSAPALPPPRSWPVATVAAGTAVGLAALLVVAAGARHAPPRAPGVTPRVAAGLIGHWRFDQPTRQVPDLSASHNDCRVRGAGDGWIGGGIGGALALGPGRSLECARPAVPLDPGGAMTAAAWIRPAQLRKFHGALVSQQLGDGWDHHFLFAVAGDDLVITSDAWDVYLRTPLRATGRWIHVAFTRAGDGRVRLFIGGRPVAEARGGALETGRTGRLVVGSTRIDPSWTHVRQPFYGDIAELMIFGRALGEAELAALATSPRT